MTTKLYTLLLLLLITFSLQAQEKGEKRIEIEKRIEFELKDGYSNETIIELGENGIIQYAYDTESSGKKDIWRYQLYDTKLEIQKEIEVKIPNNLYISKKWHNDDILITLFKDRKGNYNISNIDVKKFKESRVAGKFPKKTYIHSMTALGDFIYLNVSIKRESFLYSINWKTGAKNIIPVMISGYKSKEIHFEDFQLLKESNEAILYVQANKKRTSESYIIRLDNKGNKTDIFKLTNEIDKNLSNISAQKIGENKYIYTGTYSNKSVNTSQGMFFCEATGSKVRYIKYYKYTELKNFFKYLPERKQKKVDKKKKRKSAKGKSLNYNYLLAVHEINVQDDGYIFLGEAYYATYRTETTTTFVNGVATTTTRRVFDGYQYTHAVLAKFNINGELIWDEIFKMWKKNKPYSVKKYIYVDENNTDNKLNYIFTDAGQINTKTFNTDGKIIAEENSESIETDINGDVSKWTRSGLDYWYGNYFINFGYSKIKNHKGTKDKKGEKVKRKRKVYFISKIKYEI